MGRFESFLPAVRIGENPASASHRSPERGGPGVEVLEPVETEVAKTEIVGDSIAYNGRRRLRQQYLAAVGCSRDPCGLVHLHADVVTIPVVRFSNMQTHPDPKIAALPAKVPLPGPPWAFDAARRACAGLENTAKNESPSVPTSDPP